MLHTHSVLSRLAMDNIQKSAIKKLVVLDIIYLPEERLIDKIKLIAHLRVDIIQSPLKKKRPLLPPLFCIEKRFNFLYLATELLAGFFSC